MYAFQDSYTQLGQRHSPPDGGRLAPVKSIKMALLTEGELALSWIDSERQNNNTVQVPLLITPSENRSCCVCLPTQSTL